MTGSFLFFLEILSSVAFSVSGAMNGIMKKLDIFGVVIVGVTTAVGGGVIRDVFLGDIPYIFKKHFYACAGIIGAIVTGILLYFCPAYAAVTVGSVLIVVIRLLAAKYKINLPRM